MILGDNRPNFFDLFVTRAFAAIMACCRRLISSNCILFSPKKGRIGDGGRGMGTDGEGWVSRRSEADLDDFEDFVFLCAKRRARKSFPPFLIDGAPHPDDYYFLRNLSAE